MNKLIVMLSVFIITAIHVKAQENLTFEKVIKTDSIGKEKLYTIIYDWFASSYNSANDVIQMQDKKEGVIIGKGSFAFSQSKLAYSCYGGQVKYLIKIYVKENRYKVVLTDFKHTVKPGNSLSCQLGMITAADVYTTKGMSRKYHNNVWHNLKIDTHKYSEGVIISLESATKNKVENKDDDW